MVDRYEDFNFEILTVEEKVSELMGLIDEAKSKLNDNEYLKMSAICKSIIDLCDETNEFDKDRQRDINLLLAVIKDLPSCFLKNCLKSV